MPYPVCMLLISTQKRKDVYGLRSERKSETDGLSDEEFQHPVMTLITVVLHVMCLLAIIMTFLS